MSLRGVDLLAHKRGDIDFRELSSRTAVYLRKMARYFGRAKCVREVVDYEDLESIGHCELWCAVEAYRWRCQVCPRSASSEADFLAHRAARHPESKDGPWPPIKEYVHGRVGRAMYRAARKPLLDGKRRSTRDPERIIVPVPASQDSAAELRALIERATEVLGPRAEELLVRMADGDRTLQVRPVRRFVAGTSALEAEWERLW